MQMKPSMHFQKDQESSFPSLGSCLRIFIAFFNTKVFKGLHKEQLT